MTVFSCILYLMKFDFRKIWSRRLFRFLAFGVAEIILIFSCVAVGYVFGAEKPSGFNIDRTGESASDNSFSYINPLLDCEEAGLMISSQAVLMKQDIIDTIENLRQDNSLYTLSVYYRNLNNGEWFGLNEHEKFYPASLMKVPTYIAFIRYAEEHPEVWDRKISINSTARDSVRNIVSSVTPEKDREYPVRELLRLMIRESSNVASDAILKIMPVKYIDLLLQELGLPGSITDRLYSLEVKQYAGFFRILYNASYLNRRDSAGALKLLSETSYRKALVRDLPENITVAHKFGEREFDGDSIKQFHDCGIIYYPGNPYILCVMTRGVDLTDMQSSVAVISRHIYDQVDMSVKSK